MPKQLRNSDALARTWPRLVNADTGSTLHLEPGEAAPVVAWSGAVVKEDGSVVSPRLVDLPGDFADDHLAEAAPVPAPRVDKPEPKPAPPAEEVK